MLLLVLLNTFQVGGDIVQFQTKMRLPLMQIVVSVALLCALTLTPEMLQGEIGEQMCFFFFLNSHYKNTMLLRCKHGVCASDSWLIWRRKRGAVGRERSPKASHAGNGTRTSLLLRDHPLRSLRRRKISRQSSLSCHFQRSGSIGTARRRSHCEAVPGPGFTATCLMCSIVAFFCAGDN